MKLIVLDRDGVINADSPNFIKSAGEWHALPGSLEAIARLSKAGWTVAVASNQSGLGRGLLSRSDLKAIHRKMRRQLGRLGGRIDRVYVCPHHPDAGCQCRKPRAGLLRDIEKKYRTRLEGAPVVGDSLRDLEAAEQVGARPILVLTGNGEATRAAFEGTEEVEVYADLAAVAEALVAETDNGGSPCS
jgi:D-glycero-D-manno-heptose 1,7-bisphosphate phosphatase